MDSSKEMPENEDITWVKTSGEISLMIRAYERYMDIMANLNIP